MKMAVSIWNGRIAPVFDVSRHLVVVEIVRGVIQQRYEDSLDEDLSRKIEKIAADNIRLLVCGAISQSVAEMLAIRDIRIIPFVSGDVDEVIHACLENQLDHPRFVMPGCCRRGRRRFRAKHCGNSRLQ